MRPVVGAALVAGVLVLTGCGSSGPGAAAPPSSLNVPSASNAGRGYGVARVVPPKDPIVPKKKQAGKKGDGKKADGKKPEEKKAEEKKAEEKKAEEKGKK